MPEFGVFNDEGCIERGFITLEAAQVRAQEYRDNYKRDYEVSEEHGDPDAVAKELCPDHEEQAKDDCEECFAEYEE
jgi:hypothetical protein